MTDRDAVLEARASSLSVTRIEDDWYEVESASGDRPHTVRIIEPDPVTWTCDCRGSKSYCSHKRATRMHRAWAWTMNARGDEHGN